MVNVQGANSGDDTHVCNFKETLDAVIEVVL